ncbi:MAG: prepilin-type N-terminal cleavage/methylation domain-containing protein [Candidatus Saccharibacteria bacterium]|nr:prepilin-type N-terminal cleavage/methylation domain-containing protein [Candidatus Saccharibacteria bacterium]
MANRLSIHHFNKRGFTVIEVALVMGLAAIIFMVVFLVVPVLQQEQRDQARKRDVATVVNVLAAWQADDPIRPSQYFLCGLWRKNPSACAEFENGLLYRYFIN